MLLLPLLWTLCGFKSCLALTSGERLQSCGEAFYESSKVVLLLLFLFLFLSGRLDILRSG
jgi:hypothetical protein